MQCCLGLMHGNRASANPAYISPEGSLRCMRWQAGDVQEDLRSATAAAVGGGAGEPGVEPRKAVAVLLGLFLIAIIEVAICCQFPSLTNR